MFKNLWISVFILFAALSCSEVNSKFELPILGRDKIVEKEVDGRIVFDTIPHRIADFQFVDQDSSIITNETFKGQVYVADFFFTTCPTICPVMKQQMLRVYEAYEDDPEVALLSHTIDPKYDTVELLADFARKLGVKSEKWHFVTGVQEEIYEIGEESYMVIANEDETAPGGYIHSGAFLLIDQNRRVRGVYDGTVPEQVDLLIKDIKRLKRKSKKEPNS
ncbi:MAG: SCO family protein [Cyclobacteriaceae bacterium]